MEKKQQTATERIHEFYCDSCGDLIGQSIESHKFIYKEIGKCMWQYCDAYGNYFYKTGHYCNACKDRINTHIQMTLQALRFDHAKNK